MSIEIVPENGCPLIAVICENHIIDSEGDERLCGQPVQLKDFSLWGDEEARRRWDIVDYCPACKEALAKSAAEGQTGNQSSLAFAGSASRLGKPDVPLVGNRRCDQSLVARGSLYFAQSLGHRSTLPSPIHALLGCMPAEYRQAFGLGCSPVS